MMSNLINILAKIESLKAALADLEPMAKNDAERLWRKFRLEWNYNSNHIEGNTLTYTETALYLDRGKTTGDHNIREYEEMSAHNLAVEMVKEWAIEGSRPLTQADVCHLNRIILVKPFWKNTVLLNGEVGSRRQIIPGEFKTHPNHVLLENGEIFKYAEPEEVQQKMQELLDWYRGEAADLPPLVVTAILHYRLVRIHPFDDGNGRVCRLLLNYHLLKNDYPPVIIKTADKKNYLTALQKADAGDEESFVVYVGEQLVWSLELAIAAGKGESIEEKDDWMKKVSLLKKKVEAKKKTEEKSEEDKIAVTENWIKHNFPLIIDKFETTFQPFKEMYKESKFTISVRSNVNNNKVIDFFPKDFMEKISIGLKEKKVGKQIYFVYKFSEFIQYTYQTLNYNATINISFRNNRVLISTALNNWDEIDKSIYENLTSEDLEIINQLGQILFQKIDDFVSKLS